MAADARSARTALASHLAAAALLAAMAWAADTSAAHKSPTFDETAHLTAGFSYWATGDTRLNPENGVLPQLWAALPVWLSGAVPPDFAGPAWRLRVVWALGQQFFYDVGNDLERMLRDARRMILVFTLALGALVYAWSTRLFGPGGGLLSLWLYACCPNFLAHGRLVTSDVAASFAFPAAVGAAWWAFRRVTPLRVALCGLATAALFLSKFTAFLLLPMLATLALLRAFSPEPLPLVVGRPRAVAGPAARLAVLTGVIALAGATTAVAIWAFHGFAFRSTYGEPAPLNWARVAELGGALPAAVLAARDARLLPETWLYGLGFAFSTGQERVAFANGVWSTTGWWWFFPYALLVKTPLGTLGIWSLAAVAGLRPWLGRRTPTQRRAALWRGVDRTAPLWVLILVTWATALGSNLNIGYRHVLPSLGPLLILAGAASRWSRARSGRVLVSALLLLTALETASVHPHYLAFFNRLAGGPQQGYRRLIDSNLDWGQDLPGLARWLAGARARGDRRPCYLAYFGSARPSGHGVDCLPLPSFFDAGRPRLRDPLRPGTYAVSATMLQVLHVWPEVRGAWTREREQRWLEVQAALAREPDTGEWTAAHELYDRLRFARLAAHLRGREPDAQIGHSILIYELDGAALDAALHGPLPELAADPARQSM